MRIFLLNMAIASMLFIQQADANILPAYEVITDEQTEYTLRFHDQAPQHPDKMSVKYGPGLNYRGHFLSFNNAGKSFLEVEFDTPQEFTTTKKQVELRLSHLAAMLAGNSCHCIIEVLVNDRVFIPSFDPSDGKYSTDSFDITKLVKEGKNTLKINLKEGPSLYWLVILNVTFF